MTELIAELHVHSLDGELYYLFRAYLEKQGCIWTETRGRQRELLAVHLTFPPCTTVRELSSSTKEYKRHQVMFKTGGLMYWNTRREDGLNRIAVPFMWL